jgi:hypothetical protein
LVSEIIPSHCLTYLQEPPPHVLCYILEDSRKNEILLGEFKFLWIEQGYWNVEKKRITIVGKLVNNEKENIRVCFCWNDFGVPE